MSYIAGERVRDAEGNVVPNSKVLSRMTFAKWNPKFREMKLQFHASDANGLPEDEVVYEVFLNERDLDLIMQLRYSENDHEPSDEPVETEPTVDPMREPTGVDVNA